MAVIHNVEISWDELMEAFGSGTHDRTFYLDRLTGEIFSVSAVLDDNDFWRQLTDSGDRFLEIPRFDRSSERRILTGFISSLHNDELKGLLKGSLDGKWAFGDMDEILSFYPEEQEKLSEMKDEFVTGRVRSWLEEHNMFAFEASAIPTQFM